MTQRGTRRLSANAPHVASGLASGLRAPPGSQLPRLLAPNWAETPKKVVDILSYLSASGRLSVLAKRQSQELSEQATLRITNVVRSLAEDRVERGIELARPMHCESCDLEKPSAGSALYGEYRLCNDCLLEFTLSLASGAVENVSEFMTRRTDDEPPSASDLPRSERPAIVRPLAGREKLMPRNEPAG